jgi:hypothetical protein
MYKPLIRKAAVEDAAAIAMVNVRSWQIAYRGMMPDSFLDAFDVETRRLVWHVLTLRPDRDVFVCENKDRNVVAFCRAITFSGY